LNSNFQAKCKTIPTTLLNIFVAKNSSEKVMGLSEQVLTLAE